MIPAELAAQVRDAAYQICLESGFDSRVLPAVVRVERARNPEHGDYVSTLAMYMSARGGVDSRRFAEALADRLSDLSEVKSAEVAGPGFVNIRLCTAALGRIPAFVLREGDSYGCREIFTGGTVDVYFASISASRPIYVHRPSGVDALSLYDFVEAVGVDTARFYAALTSGDPSTVVDLESLTRHVDGNSIYCVRLAAARAASIIRNAADVGLVLGEEYDSSLFVHAAEVELLKTLGEFPDVVGTAARLREPSRIARYLNVLAVLYHGFHDNGECCVLPKGDAPMTELARSRLWLTSAIRVVFVNGLGLLGVSAPQRV